MTDKITIERETLERAIAYLEAPTAKLWPAGTLHGIAASLRAALAAQPAPAAAIPPGYALVPIDPTPEIIATGAVALMKASDSDLDATKEEIAATYRAMIAAAGDKP